MKLADCCKEEETKPSSSHPSTSYQPSRQVHLWTCSDVHLWLNTIGFYGFLEKFKLIDGDLLLQMTPEDIEKDMKNIHQKRFLRELNSLKISADYSSLDPSHVHVFLKSIDPQLCLYTYSMLKNGITLDILTASPNADDLMDTCGIKSKVHRLQLTTTLKKLWPEPHKVIPKIRLDFFISYRQDTGAELASLIKMHLELRGYRVRMDIDKNGEQDISESLLRDVQAAKNFLLVISPDNPYSKDIPCHTQLHKELRTAIQNEKNIVAVYHKDYDETRDTICLLPYDKQYLRVNWVHDYQDACVQRIVKYMYK